MKKQRVRTVLLVAGAVMLLTGLILGEAKTVFYKAAMICLECIGIG